MTQNYRVLNYEIASCRIIGGWFFYFMKARRDNKNLKIISATAVSIFSLLAVFMGTIAWFNASRIANAGNDSIAVTSPNGRFKKLSFHKLLSDPYDDATYFFNEMEVGHLEVTDWNMKKVKYVPYDAAVKTVSMDEYSILEHRHPMLLLIELDQAYNIANYNLIVDGLTETLGFVGDRSSGLVLSQTGNPLSSIVHFATYGYTQAALSATLTTYNDQSAYSFAKPAESVFKSFVTFNIDDDEETLDFSYVKEFNLYSSNVDTAMNVKDSNETKTEIKYIPIIMDYNDAALEHIYSTYLGEDVLDKNIYYNWDWELRI